MLKLRHLFVCAGMATLLALAAATQAASPVRDDHPTRYVVKKGDTLWDISKRFLKEPWRWPEVWYVNQQIANPHRIYPGDELLLSFVDGKPRLAVAKRNSVVKLSPKVRATPWKDAIPTIPIDAIAPFLTRTYVLSEAELDALPYVVSFTDEHVVGASGQLAYVRSITSDEPGKYHIVRSGEAYRDAETDEVIGHEAQFLGDAQLVTKGDPARMRLVMSKEEVLVGDRMIGVTAERPLSDFHPKAPVAAIDGGIIDVLGGINQIGALSTVVIDRGSKDGVSPGVVLRIFKKGKLIDDPVSKDRKDKVQLPDEPAGLVLVFRTFERVSFALVMEASDIINLKDRVRNP